MMTNRSSAQNCPIAPTELSEMLLRDGVLANLFAHAEQTYPEECCGFVTRGGQTHTGENVQTSLHVEDPVRHPRDGTRAFSFSPVDLMALSKSLRSDDPAICIYHSHPDAGAYFSTKDTADALYHGQPKHPVMHLVISVMAGKAVNAKLFEFDEGTFAERWCSDAVTFPHKRPAQGAKNND